MPDLQTFINRMVYWCRDADLGYSQSDRDNFRNGGNCDCSSLVIRCLKEAGFDTGSAINTVNLSAQLMARGWVRLSPTVAKQPGDILLNDVHHVAAMISYTQLAQASISENGTAYGRGGDQTGRETNISNYYNYPWNAVLRWNGESMANVPTAQENAQATASYTYAGGDTIYNYAKYASENSGVCKGYLTPRFLGARDTNMRYLWLPGRPTIPLYERKEMDEVAGDLKNIYGPAIPTVLFNTEKQLDYFISIINDENAEKRQLLKP